MLSESFARLNADPALNALLADAVGAVGAGEGSVLLLEEDGERLRFVVCHSPVAGKLVGTVQRLDRGITGLSVSLQQPMIVNDTQADPSFSGEVDKLTEVSTRSIMVVPLVGARHELGALTAINSTCATGFSTSDLERYAEAAECITDRILELLGGEGAGSQADLIPDR